MELRPVEPDVAQQIIRPFLKPKLVVPAGEGEACEASPQGGKETADQTVRATKTTGKSKHLGHFCNSSTLGKP